MKIEKKDDGKWHFGSMAFDSQEAAEIFATSRAQAPTERKALPKPAAYIVGGAAILTLIAYTGGADLQGESQAVSMCQVQIEALLKAPRSARFAAGDETSVTGTKYGPFSVRGWVEAQNSFGVTLRKRYSCTLTFKGAQALFSEARVF